MLEFRLTELLIYYSRGLFDIRLRENLISKIFFKYICMAFEWCAVQHRHSVGLHSS
jgi:hypothetical protein